MPKSHDDLYADRHALMERLILELDVGQGADISEGLSPALHDEFLDEAELLYDDWSFRSIKGGKPLASDGSPIQNLLAELSELDDLIHALTEGARKPGEPLM